MSKTNAPKRKHHNRLGAIMVHSKRYSFKGRSRLAADSGVSKSTITRLLNGQDRPSFRVMLGIAEALERDLGKKLDVRQIFSANGDYEPRYICDLMGCPGCLPPAAILDNGIANPKYRGLKPGYWTGDIFETDGSFWMPIEEIE